jgi:hypothetical protein
MPGLFGTTNPFEKWKSLNPARKSNCVLQPELNPDALLKREILIGAVFRKRFVSKADHSAFDQVILNDLKTPPASVPIWRSMGVCSLSGSSQGSSAPRRIHECRLKCLRC